MSRKGAPALREKQTVVRDPLMLTTQNVRDVVAFLVGLWDLLPPDVPDKAFDEIRVDVDRAISAVMGCKS